MVVISTAQRSLEHIPRNIDRHFNCISSQRSHTQSGSQCLSAISLTSAAFGVLQTAF